MATFARRRPRGLVITSADLLLTQQQVTRRKPLYPPDHALFSRASLHPRLFDLWAEIKKLPSPHDEAEMDVSFRQACMNRLAGPRIVSRRPMVVRGTANEIQGHGHNARTA